MNAHQKIDAKKDAQPVVEEDDHRPRLDQGATTSAPERPAPLRGKSNGDGLERKKRMRQVLLFIVPAVVLVGALLFYLHGGRYETTENAQVQANRIEVSANVDGRVVSVAVKDNQLVEKGDVLFRLDPAPYETAVEEAKAALAAARLGVEATRAQYHQGQSELKAAQDRLEFANRELARQKKLLAEGISSQAQYDKAQLEARQAEQAIQTTEHQNQSVLANLAGAPDLPADKQPEVQRAQAALDRAKLNLSYTAIRAAQEGIVTKVNQLQAGDFVKAAQPVFSLVGRRVWIEANFKEDQLAHMHVGQTVKIKVDAFPGVKLHGNVVSFSPGTGNTFSILPAENATGNWVKVVQRLPVEIALDSVPDGVALHAGLSAEATVDTGHRRSLFGPGREVAPAKS